MMLGHQAVGRMEALGRGGRPAEGGPGGRRLDLLGLRRLRGLPRGNENLCAFFRRHRPRRHGGYAERMTCPAAFAHPIPEAFTDARGRAPALRGGDRLPVPEARGLTDGKGLGLTGFGASAHLVLKMARHRYPSSEVYVFARNEGERAFARELGAVWAGETGETPPAKLAAVIDTTPAWQPVVDALRNLEPRGRLVINAIRKEERDKSALLGLDYPAGPLAGEGDQERRQRHPRRRPGVSPLAAEIPIQPEVE